MPIVRVKETLAEIKALAKKELVLAAEGAVLVLERLAPAIEEVDGSSGGIGSAVTRLGLPVVPPMNTKLNNSAAIETAKYNSMKNSPLSAKPVVTASVFPQERRL